MNAPRVLIAGIGNIFHGDDAFGVEVARRLLERPQSADVRVVDFGIRGRDLAYTLLDGIAFTILVDAMPCGQAPGTLYVLEPELDPKTPPAPTLADGHGMNPMKVLAMVRALGGQPGLIRIVGCEPGAIDPESETAPQMSEPVRRAVDDAVTLIESLVREFLNEPSALTQIQ